jgi:Zn-dependent alcohol dehydrogenase
LIRIKAVGLCHTDLEVIDGALRNPMPIILGHEAAGVVEEVGRDARGLAVGDHVILSWNPHCGHCFYCDRDLPILCEEYLRQAPLAVQFDGRSRATLQDGRELKHLMYPGALDVAFRWGSLMQEKRIRRSSYGGARPLRDFPMLAQAALDGRLHLDELISARISLDQVNEGFEALRRGAAIRSVVVFG